MKRLLEWLLLSVIALTALTLAMPHAPASVRKLVLFPIAVSLAAAAVMGSLARFSELPISRAVLALGALLILGCEVAGTLLHHRMWVAALPPVQRDPGAAMVRSKIESTLPEDDAARESYDKLLAEMRAAEDESVERQQAERRFTGYLAHRVSPLGRWPAPGPALFWAGELLIATAAGVLMLRKLSLAAGRGSPPAESA